MPRLVFPCGQVLSHIGSADPSQLRHMARCVSGPVGIKKLLLVVEMARLSGELTLASFKTACAMCGVPTFREYGSGGGVGAAAGAGAGGPTKE